ncbi:MAG: hypothetical protein ACREHD_27130 [Pirellulales bacterium]
MPLAAQTSPVAVAPANSQTAALRIGIVDRDAASLAAGSRARKGYTVRVTDSSGKPVPDAAVACRLPDSAPTGTFAQGSHSAVLFTGADGRAHISGIQWGVAAGTVFMRVTANKGIAHAGMLVEQTLAPAVAASEPPAVAPSGPPVVSVIHWQREAEHPLARREVPREDAAVLARQTPPAIAAPDQPPEVSITKPPPGAKVGHSSKKKWIILALVAGAAAGAVGFAAKGKSASSGSSTMQMSIGTPTISVGKP